MVINFGELIRRESWVVIGIIGLFLLPENRARTMIWFIVGITLFLVIRTITPVGRGLHYLVEVFPYLAIGLGVFFTRALDTMFAQLTRLVTQIEARYSLLVRSKFVSVPWKYFRKIAVVVPIILVLVNPVLWMFLADLAQFSYGSEFLFTGNDDLSLSPEENINHIVNYLRNTVGPDDLTLASPQIAWAVPGKKADFMQAMIVEGKYPTDWAQIVEGRLAYDCRLQSSTFVILDPLARDFAVRAVPGMAEVIKEVETWPLVFSSGRVDVYRNPSR